jgi:thiol-disulfide isomerase/thioredoxin
MKKLISFIVLLALNISLFTVNAVESAKDDVNMVILAPKVEVYYFHFTRRCGACVAIEEETQKALSQYFPEELKTGIIVFKSINIDESNSKALVEKYKIGGQALIVISGSNRADLTQQSFMYAQSNPDKFKQIVKSTIDPFLE